MQDTYQVNDSIHADSIQVEQAQTLTATTVAVPEAKHDQAKDISSAISVTGISMVAIFGFMFVFFLVIKAIDKYLPFKAEN